MKSENTSIRLKRIMKMRGLRQVDILRAAKPFCDKYGIKLKKNDLSQYVSGKVEPGQDKLSVLGLALDISEAWLMGYDVPLARYYNDEQNKEKLLVNTDKELTFEQKELISLFETAPPELRSAALAFLRAYKSQNKSQDIDK